MYFDTRYLYIALAIIVIINIFNAGTGSILNLLLTIPGVLIAITFHEFAHGFAADKLGDPTPRNQGRLSLNPLAHLDPFGVIMLIFAHVGWGKPVQINPNNFDRRISLKTGEAIVAAAGPVTNFILAFIIAIISCAITKLVPVFAFTQVGLIIMLMLQYAVVVNIGLGVFNLIPLPPLDGSKILLAFLSYNAKRWFEEREKLFYIIFLIIWITPISEMIISPIISAIANVIYAIVGAMFGL